MSFTFLSVAIFFLFAAVLTIEIFRGIANGLRRTLMSLGAAVLSMLISIAMAPWISGLISYSVYRMIQGAAFYEELTATFPSIGPLVSEICRVVIGILIFIPLFFVLREAIFAVAKGIFRHHSDADASVPEYSREKDSYFDINEKVLCALTSALSAILITIVIIAPVGGVLDIADKALGLVSRASPEAVESVGEENVSAVDRYSNDIGLNVFYQLGGRSVFRGITVADAYGQKNDILTEIGALSGIAEDFLSISEKFDTPGSMTQEDVAALKGIRAKMENVGLCDGILADLISNISGAWLRGNLYAGIGKPELSPIIEPAFDEVLGVCQNTEYYSARDNLGTIVDMYVAIIESGILNLDQSDMGAIIRCVESTELLTTLDSILADNGYMGGISVSSVAMRAVSKHLKESDIYDSSNYSDLMKNIADAINTVKSRGYATEEERVEVLADYAEKYLSGYGITVPESIAESTAKELLRSSEFLYNLTEGDIKNIFDNYLD
jgi:hypothetical protein